ncbi:FAD-binding protein [Paraeggerthella hongkongensis]|uniref:FAD-dependent oxidoreductase n=1 Tax=Paraeggerthella TaxID=651554 RepID=UPI001C1289EC|nr:MULTISPECIES: FAD-binding protein [Paraeggerthella]MBU5404811.1 FAD-binding protein [Paraeggerthella hongkongensis]MCD2433201.1 FAD-binding protein [Paraeggerthella hominis]
MSNGMEGGVSRRSFLKGAGVAAAAVAGSAALAGCASGSTGAAAGDWMPKNWDYECDLLVIGYGGAGMWASLIGADECGQEVIVLEKAPERGGGNSSINNGEWTIVEESEKDRFKKYIKSFTHGKTPEPMIDAWVNECARNTEYADKYGMTYEVTEVALAGAIPEYYFLDDNAYEGSCKLSSVDGFGMLSFHELDAKREELGVQLFFDCHDERLIQNPETKEIVGAYTMIGNEEKTVKARKGVILTLGGFEFNEELKNEYLKCYPFKFEGWQYNTGDGIKMVEDVGAKLWHMDMVISMYSMWTRDPENDFSILYFMPGFSYFNVNRLGKRFVDDTAMGSPHNGWHTLLHFDDAIDDYDRIPTWCIFDQSCFDAGKLSTSQGDFFECGNFASDLPDSVRAWDGWSQDNKAEVEKGWIIKADTIEELGKKIKEFDHWMDVDTLKATFEEYQGFCAAGKDARFDRAAKSLVALDGGPYYAISVYPGSCSTLGGPMKNEHAQVLDPQRNPIPRLYAAGCFGNFQAHSYGITGGNNAENQVWGRISARHAAGLDAWDAK